MPVLKNKITQRSIEFITAGVGCNCMVLLSEAGIIDRLVAEGSVTKNTLEGHCSSHAVFSALTTLIHCNAIVQESNTYFLTDFGKELVSYLGLITVFFDGYGKLVSHQGEIARGSIEDTGSLIRGKSVSKASKDIAEKKFNPIIVAAVQELKLLGTICDLGCGYGVMLTEICRQTNNPGLGFEFERSVVEEARRIAPEFVEVRQGDITQLDGIWEDVIIGLQCHLFHDFEDPKCTSMLNSYRQHFPNLQVFFYIDTVAPSFSHNELLPGFDYVHGLLGQTMRNYEQTIQMFDRTCYCVKKEIPIPDLPNTYLWVLRVK